MAQGRERDAVAADLDLRQTSRAPSPSARTVKSTSSPSTTRTSPKSKVSCEESVSSNSTVSGDGREIGLGLEADRQAARRHPARRRRDGSNLPAGLQGMLQRRQRRSPLTVYRTCRASATPSSVRRGNLHPHVVAAAGIEPSTFHSMVRTPISLAVATKRAAAAAVRVPALRSHWPVRGFLLRPASMV